MRTYQMLIVPVVALFGPLADASAQPGSGSSARSLTPSDSLIRVEAAETHREIAALKMSVDSLRYKERSWPETWGGILVGVIATVSGFGVAVYSAKRTADAARDARLETHLYDALKWFEGKTQKRSIGLSIIEGNWSQGQLHPTWRGVLLNQATYLLSVSDTDTEHELQNLNRIRVLLERCRLVPAEEASLADALKARDNNPKAMPGVATAPWDRLARVTRDGSK